MRPITLTVVVFAVACSSEKKPDKTETKPAEPVPSVPKKVIDQKPLPPLAADPGGATGKPAWATAFGGLSVDAPKAIAVAADGSSYVVGYFEGETDFGPPVGKKT